MHVPIPQPVKTGATRDGVAYIKSDVNKWIIAGGLNFLMLDARQKHEAKTQNGKDFHTMSDVSEAYDTANEAIKKASEAMDKTLQKFRSTIKNDLASISSASDKVANEVQKINKSYLVAIETLTSEKFNQAILNAERLAKALELISQVQSSDISLSLGKDA